jgi:hypothetical protein
MRLVRDGQKGNIYIYIIFFNFFFWVRFFDVAKTIDNSQEDLAIFGYRPDVESREIVRILFIYLATSWNLL